MRRALYTCKSGGRGVTLNSGTAVPRQSIASAPAHATPGGGAFLSGEWQGPFVAAGLPAGGLSPGTPLATVQLPPGRPPLRPPRGQGVRATAGAGLTWECTSPRPLAAPRSPSRAAPSPRRSRLTLPPPLPPAGRCWAAAGWRRGSRGRTPGR